MRWWESRPIPTQEPFKGPGRRSPWGTSPDHYPYPQNYPRELQIWIGSDSNLISSSPAARAALLERDDGRIIAAFTDPVVASTSQPDIDAIYRSGDPSKPVLHVMTEDELHVFDRRVWKQPDASSIVLQISSPFNAVEHRRQSTLSMPGVTLKGSHFCVRELYWRIIRVGTAREQQSRQEIVNRKYKEEMERRRRERRSRGTSR